MFDFNFPKLESQTDNTLKPGDKVIVSRRYQATVEKIWFDKTTSRTQIDLDWGVNGKSKVFAHDEGKVWHKLGSFN